MKPLLLVSTVAPPIVAVFTLPAAGAAWPLLPPEEPPEEVPDELHPTTSAATAVAGSANSIHGRRLRAFGVARDLSIAFSFAGACPAVPARGRGDEPSGYIDLLLLTSPPGSLATVKAMLPVLVLACTIREAL